MNTMSNSERLRRKIELVLPTLGAASSEVIHHPQFRELYPEFLVTVHWMIRATVPLMRTALQRCHELEATCPVAAAIVPFLTQHIKAEMDHDEWLLQDLELIGVPRSEVLKRMPSPTVAAMIGAHYYWIHHHHPVAKLGQVAVMDGYPAPVEVVELMAAKTGYPRKAFRTIERHCHLDIKHRRDFDDALDGMPLQEEHHKILGISALHTVHMGAKAYREVLERVPKLQPRDSRTAVSV